MGKVHLESKILKFKVFGSVKTNFFLPKIASFKLFFSFNFPLLFRNVTFSPVIIKCLLKGQNSLKKQTKGKIYFNISYDYYELFIHFMLSAN